MYSFKRTASHLNCLVVGAEVKDLVVCTDLEGTIAPTSESHCRLDGLGAMCWRTAHEMAGRDKQADKLQVVVAPAAANSTVVHKLLVSVWNAPKLGEESAPKLNAVDVVLGLS